MNLAQTQQAFSAWLRTGAPDAGMFDPNALLGLGIYQNNYRSQLASCLEDSFAITRQWIGGDTFHEAVVHHVERVPPSSWTLDAYPRDFPQTLALRCPDDPEVAELATLELALAEAFVAPDEDPVPAAEAAAADWDSAVLRLTPTLDLQPVTTNTFDICTALGHGATPPAAQLLACPASLLVWRQGETPLVRVVEQAETHALLAARNGLPFASLCAQLVDMEGAERGTALAGQWLGQWLADGLITGIA